MFSGQGEHPSPGIACWLPSRGLLYFAIAQYSDRARGSLLPTAVKSDEDWVLQRADKLYSVLHALETDVWDLEFRMQVKVFCCCCVYFF